MTCIRWHEQPDYIFIQNPIYIIMPIKSQHIQLTAPKRIICTWYIDNRHARVASTYCLCRCFLVLLTETSQTSIAFIAWITDKWDITTIGSRYVALEYNVVLIKIRPEECLSRIHKNNPYLFSDFFWKRNGLISRLRWRTLLRYMCLSNTRGTAGNCPLLPLRLR